MTRDMDWIEYAIEMAMEAPTDCDGCGAGEGALSVYTADGRGYCCRVCRNGGRCECRQPR